MSALPGHGRRGRRGTILIVTMWLLTALAGLALVLASAMRVEGGVSANQLAALQADAIEHAAVQYVLAHVARLDGELPQEGDMPCESVRVGEGAFWIIRRDSENDGAVAYGLVDEASKVNLNTAPQALMAALPGMTSEIAAAIVDWRDGDDTLTPGGAEDQYYLLLGEPYHCKNAPLETVEETLLVQGMTPAILYGEDVNLNETLDANEDDADECDPPDNGDGRLERGLIAFATVHSWQPNTTVDGESRVNVNSASMSDVREAFGEVLGGDRLTIVLDRVRLFRPFRNLLEMYVRTGLTAAEFAPLSDRLTTRSGTRVTGLVNVNTAPREVLAALSGLDEADVSALLSRRAESATDLTNLAWVAQAIAPAKAIAIGDFITTYTCQYSADIVSAAGNGRAFRRCRIIVDASGSTPRVVFRQDLTHLGWPLDQDILDRLRAGKGFGSAAANQAIGNR